ncbi:carbohydrate-binding family 9-like protein [Marinilabiliaceae bacterium JC017]|nr:carbohydrate-binding family 9-like protein [Marinilabiliaceae bacterium JC017]
MKYIWILFIFLIACNAPVKQAQTSTEKKAGQIALRPFNPKSYICYKTTTPLTINGKMDETAWQNAPWTDLFVDIEGDKKPVPPLKTRAKMLWDDHYFYVAAELEDPHIWATLTQRDTVIYYDNDFEVFIDPDGDTHGYYEFEMNAFNTVWDLMLIKPYRDGGPAINNWDINGLKTAVSIDGTINNPSDIDKKWTVEIAFPLTVLSEFNTGKQPAEGVQWRVNFSRVQWHTEVVDGRYKKKINPETGRSYPEENWVWSPQGVINMHCPETWAFVQFTEEMPGKKEVEFQYNPEEDVKWELRTIYYAQRAYREKHGTYCKNLNELAKTGLDINAFKFNPKLETTSSLYEAVASKKGSSLVWHIDQAGRTWVSK